MNYKQKKKVEALKRRSDFLTERIAERADEARPAGDFDKMERAALKFALECIDLADRAGLLTPGAFAEAE